MRRKLGNMEQMSIALQKTKDTFKRKAGREAVSLEDACGRKCAEDVYAVNTIPLVRSSGGDGIGVRSADFCGRLPDTGSWQPGRDYVRADTGDDFEDAFDAVIMIENVKINEDGSVEIEPEAAGEVTAGQNVRPAGSIVKPGQLIIPAGKTITPSDQAAAAMAGAREITVYKKPVITFIPTGSELVHFSKTPKRGQNVDCNSFMVKGLIEEYGGEPRMHEIIKDDYDMISEAVDEALAVSDIVIVNGGSSKGSEDYNTRIVREKGTFLFHGVASVPGRPMSASVTDKDVLLVNLPGPTVGAFNCMEWYIHPIVAAMMDDVPERIQIPATLAEDLKAPPFMAFHCRIRLERDAEKGWLAYPLKFDNASNAMRITSDGGYLSPKGEGLVEKGSVIWVDVYNHLKKK